MMKSSSPAPLIALSLCLIGVFVAGLRLGLLLFIAVEVSAIVVALLYIGDK